MNVNEGAAVKMNWAEVILRYFRTQKEAPEETIKKTRLHNNRP